MNRNSETERKLQPLHHGMCGGVSGFLTRVAAQPLDVLKIRFQLQSEPIRRKTVKGNPVSSKYSGVIQAAVLISREEGITALWKGHVPAQALSLVYGSVQFVTFELLQRKAWKYGNKAKKSSTTSVLHFLFGGMAGTAATICCHPLDVVRTRFVAQGEPKLYRSINEAVACMVKEGGIRTFYKGLVPTLVAIFPNASFQFGFYHLLKLSWQRYQGVSENQLGKVPKLLCGAMSGIISKLLLIPFDVVKKRLQIQGFEGARQQFGKVRVYNGMANCFVRIVADEGVAGLFKGSSASVLKSSLVVGLTFFTYEQCCASMRQFKV